MRYRSDGRWVDYDLNLAVGPDGLLHAAAAPGAARLAAATAGPHAPVATVETPAGQFRLRHPQAAAPAAASLHRATATYPGALGGGRSLELAVTPEGFEETVVVPDAGAPVTYLDHISLPAGVRARQASPTDIEFVDGAGAVVATFGGGMASDATFPAAGLAATTPVTVRLVGTEATPAREAIISVGVDPAWLAEPGRAWPLRIDPLFTTSTATAGADTYIYSADPNSSFGSSGWLFTGSGDGGISVARSLVRFDLSSLPPSHFVTESHLSLYEWYSPSCSARSVTASGLGGPFSNTTTWNTAPPLDGAGVVSSTSFAYGASGCPAARANLDLTSLARRWILDGAANHGLELRAGDEFDPAANKGFNSGDTGVEYAPTLYVTYNRLPGQASAASPANNATVSSATPRLSVNPATDPDGDTVEYFFRITATADAETGAKAESRWWSTDTFFDVPAGYLQDGVTYYWHAWTRDANGQVAPTWTSSFKVELNVGRAGTAPVDEAGPLAVNLASGNLSFTTSSPTLATAAGPVGVSFTYNAQATDDAAGVAGAYFADPSASRSFVGKTPAMERRDADVNSAWPTGASPGPGLGGQNFLVRWSGVLRVPNTGTWRLGAGSDDGVRIIRNGQAILERWDNPPGVAGAWSNEIWMEANQPQTVVVEYYQATGPGFASLTAAGPINMDGSFGSIIVPSRWLSTDQATSLPAGWSLSAGAGGASAYAGARPAGDTTALVDASGSAHRWTRLGSGYVPPAGETGVLATDGAGLFSLHDSDGTTYGFDGGGRLRSTTAADVPGAIELDWGTTAPARLRFVRDTATARHIALRYGGDAGQCTFAVPGGFDPAPPAGMLCQVDYWDNTSTRLYYKGAQLVRVVDPGDAVSQFTYQAGLVRSLRLPLASDAVNASQAGDSESSNTVVAYNPGHQVTSLTLPEPKPGALRPGRSYVYTTGSNNTAETTIKVDGLNPAGYSRKVGFDAGRPVSDTDATGEVTASTWDPTTPLVWSSTDPAGRRTTYHYDDAHRPTEVFGPAPVACFGADRRPNASCAPMPHTTTTYDGTLRGLAAAYWNNTSFSGPPVAFDTGVGTAGGALARNWGYGSPAAGVAVDQWTARFSGEIHLPNPGTYSFALNVDDAAEVFIDDALVVSAGCCGASAPATVSVTRAGWHRIRVDYLEASATAWLELSWTPPNGTQGLVPGTHLKPGYGLTTKTVAEDTTAPQSPSHVVDVAYDQPHTGQATSSTEDPSVLALTTSATFEAPGAGSFGRRLSKTLPAGTTTTYAYYGAGETRTNPCPGGASAVQSGQLRTATGPDPDGTGPGTARADEYVYDTAGRTVASRVGTGAWACVTYDQRGRPTSRTVPASATHSARTVTYDWAVGTNPLVTSVSDPVGTIATTVDLLGRIVSYTDAVGNTSTSSYDQAGRAVGSATPARGWSAAMAYDDAGRPTVQRLDGYIVALATYNGAGELASVDYPLEGGSGNGTGLSAVNRDQAGRLVGLTWRGDVSAIATDAVARSQAGRVLTNTVDGVLAHSYTYDGAGRLVGATVPGHNLSYEYASTGGCGPLAGAGRNTNRTKLIDTTPTAVTTTTYCYDAADRLVSANDASVGTPAYDGRGNTTTLGPQSLAYDGADRHMATTTGTTTVTYDRDATDRIVARKVNGTVVATYGYDGPGDSPFMVNANTGVLGAGVYSRFIGVIGGASIHKGVTGGDTWSYPNIHGDVMTTADAVGLPSATFRYDPFGTPLAGHPQNAPGNFDYGWLGQHQRPLEREAGIATIEMGARQYVPKLGRFLEVDPVESGSASDYEYGAGDPINKCDYGGQSVAFCFTYLAVGFRLCGEEYNTCMARGGRIPKIGQPICAAQFAKCMAPFIALFARCALDELRRGRRPPPPSGGGSNDSQWRSPQRWLRLPPQVWTPPQNRGDREVSAPVVVVA